MPTTVGIDNKGYKITTVFINKVVKRKILSVNVTQKNSFSK